MGNKFFRVVPKFTLIVVLATLVSQFSVVVASLLPLKVVMLLGSEKIPQYFPSFFWGIDRDILIVFLSLLAVGFYILHFLSEKIVSYGAMKGANLLLEKSQKMALFENQDVIANQGYQRYSRSLATSILLFFISLSISLIYPYLALVLMGYAFVVFLVLLFLYSKEGQVKEDLENSPGKVLGTATNIGFLIAFFFMVGHFLWGDPPGLLVAVVALILMRQGFSRITGLVNDLKGLYDQRTKINALFFHGHVLVKEIKRHETAFWSLLQTADCNGWIVAVLRNTVDELIEKVKVEWDQLGIPDVAAFKIEAFGKADEKKGRYIIKLFGSNKKAQARHEATLLLGNRELPALSLLGVDEIHGLNCHVFKWCPIEQFLPKQIKAIKNNILKRLMIIEPSQDLSSKYSRSRPLLWQRVDEKLVERLMTISRMTEGSSDSYVYEFSNKYIEIMERVQKLPLVIVNPEISQDLIYKDGEDELLLIHWVRWSLEPVGAGWSIESEQLDQLHNAIQEAQASRAILKDVNINDAKLAAFLFEVERLCRRQQFIQALTLIPEILGCWDRESEDGPLAESKA
ncbi:hypothetical protein [Salinicola avicenniae]|uniref:hypothetical protein n=1 Tax=Salinicola avicenniae TaxID=2916836 RepID=UPI002074A4EB|nr:MULTISPECIES: hypothetical protein [unclassified Salinicola]